MSKFEIGDSVKVIGVDYYLIDDLDIYIGQIGCVVEVDGVILGVLFEDGKTWYFTDDELEGV